MCSIAESESRKLQLPPLDSALWCKTVKVKVKVGSLIVDLWCINYFFFRAHQTAYQVGPCALKPTTIVYFIFLHFWPISVCPATENLQKYNQSEAGNWGSSAEILTHAQWLFLAAIVVVEKFRFSTVFFCFDSHLRLLFAFAQASRRHSWPLCFDVRLKSKRSIEIKCSIETSFVLPSHSTRITH